MIKVLLRAGLAFLAMTPAALADDDAIARGKYLFDAAGCAGCHTDVKNKGKPLAGRRALKTPFGVFYAPNITPDNETGIGRWSEADFFRALRQGLAPDGGAYFPVFPYPSYTGMSDADLGDLREYMLSLPPVAQENRAHDVSPPFGWRFLVPVWKWLYFTPGPLAPDPDKSAEWNRGAYLVEALAHCGECHTPRDAMGGKKKDFDLAGTPEGPEGELAPNITPDDETGIGKWSDSELHTLFTDGALPDFDFVSGGMAEVVENSTSRLTNGDRAAIIAYLRSLPPIRNVVSKKK